MSADNKQIVGWKAQLRKGLLEMCVLQSLTSKPMYGYELVGTVRDILAAGEGTIYPILSRLERDNNVSGSWRTSSHGPPRKYYSLTAQGHETLSLMLDVWVDTLEAVKSVMQV